MAIVFIGQLLLLLSLYRHYFSTRRRGATVLKFWMHAWVTKRRWSMVKSQSPDPPSYRTMLYIIQGEMGLFLTFSIFELQRGYLYQNGVEFRQKVTQTFPSLSVMWASAPIAERAISIPRCSPSLTVPLLVAHTILPHHLLHRAWLGYHNIIIS